MQALAAAVVLWLGLAASGVAPYSYMVPQDACFSMMPAHNGSAAQSGVAPFRVVADSLYYGPLDRVRVTILGTDPVTRFTGFLLQARQVRTNTLLGTWTLEPLSAEFVGILKCTEKNVKQKKK